MSAMNVIRMDDIIVNVWVVCCESREYHEIWMKVNECCECKYRFVFSVVYVVLWV